jgi:hypothetical protein
MNPIQENIIKFVDAIIAENYKTAHTFLGVVVENKIKKLIAESSRKSHPFKTLKEANKPDYIDIDKDGNKKESMKKAANDKVTDKSTGKKYAKTKAFGNQKKKTPHKMKNKVLPRKQKHKKAGEKE